MSGKPYTMREMKSIVDYLTEHRAYSEIKGRKMWMDLATSKVTSRTWQSLKETFLKRIRPDIHNPYYKLTKTQIYSFQQGQDIEKRLNKRLQICSTSKDSSDDFKEKDTETAGNSNDINEDNIAGEDPKLSNLRASTETLVLDNCYENVEEIIKDLQSSTGVEEPQPTKSMRDLLTYSEPLTPMLQSVIDDFVSEDEEDPKMQIVEAEHETIEQNAGDEKEHERVEENVTIEISDSEGNDLREETNQTKTTDVDLPSSSDKNEHAITTSKTKETEVTAEKSTTLSSETKNITNEKDSSSQVKNADGDNTKRSSDITQNNSASITDTLLPGNQEAFEEKQKKMPIKRNLRSNKNVNLENGRKRASSQELEPKTNKRILSKLKSVSDSERSVPSDRYVFEKSKFSTLKQNLPEESDKTSSNVNNEKCENTSIPEETVKNSQDTVMKSSPEIENPCLKNVSLYAEQFSTEKYMDSDTSNNEDEKIEKVDRNKTNENIEQKSKKGNEKIDDQSEDKIDKTGEENKKEDDENEKNSDKIDNTVDKNKKIDDKNKRLEDKNKKKIESNEKAGDKHKNTSLKYKKKIEITEKANDNIIINIENNNKEKIDSNNKTQDKNIKNDKPSSRAGPTSVKDNVNVDDDVVMLRSHSESVTESGNEVRRGRDRLVRQQRDNSLANMFGFASGGTSRRQRRGTDRRKRTISHSHKHNYGNVTSASSDWTSDTGSEYVSSPPRQYGRKGRHTRKYLKPRSAPILSLEEEGGLFVMYNKKIYPVVKDGKSVKNYVTYTPDDNFEQDESFWKLKYVEEKKKNAELTKLLSQTKGKEQQGEPSRVPAVLPTTAQNSNALAVQETLQPASTKNVPETSLVPKAQPNPAVEDREEKKTVKIKLIKNDQEVQLEGHWSQLSPVMAHVVQLFQNEPNPVTASNASSKTDSLAPEPMVESGRSTPSEEVVEKVNNREKEIAQEIERYHKEEANAIENPPQTQNVTKRRGRPRKTSPAVPPSPAKMAKLDVTERKATTEPTEKEEENNTTVTTRTKRTPRKLLAETVEVNQNTIIRTRRTTPRKSLEKIADSKQTNPEDPDADIRYRFPTQPPATRKSYTKTNAVANKTSQRNTKSTSNVFSSPENKFINSMESTQGYQDSDISPLSICTKKRRKTSLSFATHRKRYTTRYRQRNHHVNDLITSDSSNSFQSSRIKTITFQNSTITSEIYKSESYRLLMNKDSKPAKNTSNLGRILEASPALKDFDLNMETYDEIAMNGNSDLNDKEKCLQINTDDNSSNMSLPTSPVLSIVENISISKTFLDSMDLDDYRSDDKKDNENGEQITLNHLMTPDVDVDMPLMNQECGIEKSRQEGQAYHYNMSISKTDAGISESLLNKINTVNIQDPTLSDTLNAKLKDLILESAKKIHNGKNNLNDDSKDTEVNDKLGPKKTNSKKRSSTPRKRQSKRKKTPTNTEPRIVEEHIESCSRVGRQSCPPVILICEPDSDEIITPIETESTQNVTLKPTKGRKKKDIIKVKITKPKSQTQSKQNNKTNFSDSGINDTETELQLLQASDESVDLIHNHSETCLNAHECMIDSVIVLDDSADSNISLGSNTTSERVLSHHTVGNISDNQELFSSDAQDGTDLVKEYDFVEPRQVNSAATTVYHTPIGTQLSPNSIMTDDLSDEIPEEPIRNTEWYLLTEDEASNTNYCFNINKNSEATAGYGAKLEKIFPVTCAVPDLSTITEVSRENGDSKKFSDDTNTGEALNSPSIFQ